VVFGLKCGYVISVWGAFGVFCLNFIATFSAIVAMLAVMEMAFRCLVPAFWYFKSLASVTSYCERTNNSFLKALPEYARCLYRVYHLHLSTPSAFTQLTQKLDACKQPDIRPNTPLDRSTRRKSQSPKKGSKQPLKPAHPQSSPQQPSPWHPTSQP
jgi:hypothetical protein